MFPDSLTNIVQLTTNKDANRTFVCGSMSARCWTSISAVGTPSSWAARCIAVRPFLACALASAKCSSNKATMSEWPSCVARCRGVKPFYMTINHLTIERIQILTKNGRLLITHGIIQQIIIYQHSIHSIGTECITYIISSLQDVTMSSMEDVHSFAQLLPKLEQSARFTEKDTDLCPP